MLLPGNEAVALNRQAHWRQTSLLTSATRGVDSDFASFSHCTTMAQHPIAELTRCPDALLRNLSMILRHRRSRVY